MTQKQVIIEQATNGWVLRTVEDGWLDKLEFCLSVEEVQKALPEILKGREPSPLANAITSMI